MGSSHYWILDAVVRPLDLVHPTHSGFRQPEIFMLLGGFT